MVHPVLFELAEPYEGRPLDATALNWENQVSCACPVCIGVGA
jgi:hypothetical protein